MLILLIFSLQTAWVLSAVNASIHNLRCSNKPQTWQEAMTECVSEGGRPASFRELSDFRGKAQIIEENVWTSNYFSSFSHVPDNSSMKPANLELCGFLLLNCDGYARETLYSLCSHTRLYLCRNTTKTAYVTLNKDVQIFNGTWDDSKDCENVSLGELYGDFPCPAYYWKNEIWPGKMYELQDGHLPDSRKRFICGSISTDIQYFFGNCSAPQKSLCYIDESNINFGTSCFNDTENIDGSHTTEVLHVTESLLEQKKDKLGTGALVGIIVTVCIVVAGIVVSIIFICRRYGCIIKTSNKQSNGNTSSFQTKDQRPRSVDGHSNAAYERTSDQLNLKLKAESAVYSKVKKEERAQHKLTANNETISSNCEFAIANTDDFHSSTTVLESENTNMKTQDPMYSHDVYNTTLLVRKVNKHTDSTYDKMSSGDHQANNEYYTTLQPNKLRSENDLYNKLSSTSTSFTKPNTKETTQVDFDEDYDSVSRSTGQIGAADNIYNTLH